MTHSAIQAIFNDVSKTRKVFLASNSAENLFTFPGISFIVDCGLVRQDTFDIQNSITSSKVQKNEIF